MNANLPLRDRLNNAAELIGWCSVQRGIVAEILARDWCTGSVPAIWLARAMDGAPGPEAPFELWDRQDLAVALRIGVALAAEALTPDLTELSTLWNQIACTVAAVRLTEHNEPPGFSLS